MSTEFFRVNSRVLLQLGEELVSDHITAILELIKNSYDADASWVNVEVEADFVAPPDAPFPGAKGRIVVEDDGFGMDYRDIADGWLTVSYSPKRIMKREGRLTPKQRTPLGDKGLGRLGVQQLGGKVELYTCKKGKTIGHQVAVDWSKYTEQNTLDSVPVPIQETGPRIGTRIVISDLKDASVWERGGIADLQQQLSKLLNPYDKSKSFVVSGSVNGESLELADFEVRLQDAAVLRCDFEFAGENLAVHSRYRLPFLRSTGWSVDDYNRAIGKDKGAGFFSFFTEEKKDTTWEFNPGGRWFVERRVVVSVPTLDDIGTTNGTFASPGPFDGRIDAFRLDKFGNSVFDKLADFRDFVRRHVGVRCYRDGFGIRPYGIDEQGKDWLGLGESTTAGTSYYLLRPQNVLGYVNLTAKDNSSLREKTDREGFTDDVFSRNFMRILQQVVTTINNQNESLRRAALEYRRTIGEVSVDAKQNLEQLMETVKSQRYEMQQIRQSVSASHASQMSEIVATLPSAKDETIVRLDDLAKEFETLASSLQRAKNDFDSLMEQVQSFSELAALGMTAEVLAHEMREIADRLSGQTNKQFRRLKAQGEPSDRSLVLYFRTVQSTVSTMRKQITHLGPSLRYVRERQDEFNVATFLREIADFHKNLLRDTNTELQLVGIDRAFWVKMNKGKLTQVIDNMLFNAEYWLEEQCPQKDNHLTIELDPPMLLVWDDGYGIDPSVEYTLFEPFVTMKPRGKGRGLGLFIVRQLLDSSGCDISLLPERNEHRRRYKFQIDMSGAWLER